MIKRLALVLCVQLIVLVSVTSAQILDLYRVRPGSSAAEIIKARGFNTEQVYLVSDDGYRLELIRAWSPLIDGARADRPPILFIHGLTAQANCYVVNSNKARPRDFSSFDLSDQSMADLVAQDPSAKSLPLLAMNFGHEVWLLNRRGVPGSQTKVNGPSAETNAHLLAANESTASSSESEPHSGNSLAPMLGGTGLGPISSFSRFFQALALSFDPDFWSYSVDEQAEYDFPMALDYIQKRNNGAKVVVVGHSLGATIPMMTLAERPEIADRIASAILWSPALTLGQTQQEVIQSIVPLQALLESIKGPFPPPFLTTQIEASLELLCSTALARRTFCKAFLQSFFGDGGYKEPLYPEVASALFYPAASHEIAHLTQAVSKFGGSMHKYDYGAASNLAKYNQAEPPMYDPARILLNRMSIWVSRTDNLVSAPDVQATAAKLTVPHKFHLIDEVFSHAGYFFHEDNARLAIVPTLLEIHQLSTNSE